MCLLRGRPARHHRGIEAVPAPEASGLAGAARVVVCQITGDQRAREGFTCPVAEGVPGTSREGSDEAERLFPRPTHEACFPPAHRSQGSTRLTIMCSPAPLPSP